MSTLSFAFLAFNNWPILERTLESAKKLKHTQDVEYVIVNNSTEEYYFDIDSKISDWMEKNPSLIITTVSNSGENSGEGDGMNICFNMCSSENILFFQDDWECVVDYPFIDLAIDVLDKFEHIFMIQLSKREWSSTNKNVRFGRLLFPPQNDLSVIEMADNGFGNNTSQIRLFKKSSWEKVGPYLDTKTIDWNRWKGHREGSVVEFDYGVRLNNLGYRAAKINDGQFIHTIEENARSEYFISNAS